MPQRHTILTWVMTMTLPLAACQSGALLINPSGAPTASSMSQNANQLSIGGPQNNTGGGGGGNTVTGGGATTGNPPPACAIPNACGTCTPAPFCTADSYGANGNVPLPPPAALSGTVQTPNGLITIASNTTLATHFAWPANANDGTVSRVDTILVEETARYATVRHDASGNPNVPPYNAVCNNAAGYTNCNVPSRTAVDSSGNVYVANRNWSDSAQVTYARQGSVTKIGYFDPSVCDAHLNPGLAGCQCKDFNKDGIITTSRDINNDGSINMASSCTGPCTQTCHVDADCTGGAKYCFAGQCSTTPQEFFGESDECILWTVALPEGPYSAIAADAKARALAVDANGFVWVGDWHYRTFFKLTPQGQFVDPDGAGPLTATGGVPVGLSPYGAVVDSNHNLWTVTRNGSFQSINVDTAQTTSVTRSPAGDGYGITIDQYNHVWTPPYSGHKVPTVSRYDPETNTWHVFGDPNTDTFDYKATSLCGRGITATPKNSVWAAFNNGSDCLSPPNWIVEYAADTGAIIQRVRLDLDSLGHPRSCTGTIGVGFDAGGKIWAVGNQSDTACAYNLDNEQMELVPVGNKPYTYSDFTGSIFRNFTTQQGTYSLQLNGCSGNYRVQAWHGLTITAVTPGQSSIQVRSRAAVTAAQLSAAPFSSPFVIQNATAANPQTVPLPYLGDEAVQVEFTFNADSAGNVPALIGVNVARECLFVGGG